MMEDLDNEILEEEEEEANESILDRNTSFLSSLNDDELIEFICKLSQEKRNKGVPSVSLSGGAGDDQSGDEGDVLLDITDTNYLDLEGNDDEEEEELPFQLAQPQKDELIQDINEVQRSLSFSSDAEGESDEAQVFGDYHSYFVHKAKNQQRLDEEYLTWEKERQNYNDLQRATDQDAIERLQIAPLQAATTSEILKGCIIHVNGHTTPNIHTLHKLIVLNGGRFLHHLSSKGQVTHIIAERLTPRKCIEFKNCKVVKPQWVLESLKEGKVLDWVDYSVIGVGYGQKRLNFKRRDDVDIENGGQENNEIEGDVENEEVEVEVDNNVESEDNEQEEQVSNQSKELKLAIDSKHPDFLKMFFEKSRLHHLSTWKSDLRYEFLQKMAKRSTSPISNNKNSLSKIIIHVDFDCFFAKVSSLNHPEINFETQPVCVTHATGDFKNSSAEISSCNYTARKFGVRNGMWLKSAIMKCPSLVCLGYEFAAYERISRLFYDVLGGINADSVFPVSVDEALLNVTSLFDRDDDGFEVELKRFCWSLKEEILRKTGCIVSLGCAKNVLLAKLCLKRAKPDGVLIQLTDDEEELQDWIDGFNVVELPGIGASIEFKLVCYLQKEKKFVDEGERLKVGSLRGLEKLELQNVLGLKNGNKLFQYIRGVDSTSIMVKPDDFVQKSVSIEISWGIRFDEIEQVDAFIFKISENLCEKLQKFELLTEQIVLKIMKRAKDAPVEPSKFLGHGLCDSFSKLTNLGVASDDFRNIGNEIRSLYRFIGCEPVELRGIGVTLAKLVNKAKVGNQRRLKFGKLDDVRKRIEQQQQQQQQKPLERVEKKLEKDDMVGADVQEIPNDEDENLSFTQLEIPSDLDSSILKQLPSSITKQIRNQQQRNLTSIESLPSQIDLKILKELPKDIQDELTTELRRRNIGADTGSKRNYFMQQIFPVDSTSPKKLKVLKRPSPMRKTSPKKRKLSPSKNAPGESGQSHGINALELIQSPTKNRIVKRLEPVLKVSDLDQDVLNELPVSLRESIVREYESYGGDGGKRRIEFNEDRFRKYGEEYNTLLKDRDFYTIGDGDDELVFQKMRKVSDIVGLIRRWVYSTLKNGPNDKDVALFEKYLGSLDKSDKRLFKKGRYYKVYIIQELEVLLKLEKREICDKWRRIITDLMN